ENHFSGKQLVDGVRRCVYAENFLQTVFSVIETECLSADSVSEFLNHISLFVGVSVGYCHCHSVLAVLRRKSLCFLGSKHECLVIINLCKLAFFSCHWLQKLAFHYGAVEAEFASAAEKSLIHSALSVRNCLNQHIAVSLQMHGASNRTVCACSIHSFC